MQGSSLCPFTCVVSMRCAFITENPRRGSRFDVAVTNLCPNVHPCSLSHQNRRHKPAIPWLPGHKRDVTRNRCGAIHHRGQTHDHSFKLNVEYRRVYTQYSLCRLKDINATAAESEPKTIVIHIWTQILIGNEPDISLTYTRRKIGTGSRDQCTSLKVGDYIECGFPRILYRTKIYHTAEIRLYRYVSQKCSMALFFHKSCERMTV